MDTGLKILIADDEHFICDLLQELIAFQELGLRLVGTVSSGDQLLEAIEEREPDIVITDISMPKMNGLEVIRRVHESRKSCRFIIISGYRQFDYAYSALKYDVEDYILKPVDQAELNDTLRKVVKDIRGKGQDGHAQADSSMSLYHLLRGIEHLESRPLTIEKLNRSYGMEFQPGRFQMLMAKIDCVMEPQPADVDIPFSVKQTINMMREHFSCCHTMAFKPERGSVLALLNYPADQDSAVDGGVKELFAALKDMTDRFHGLALTFCVSRAAEDPDQLLELLTQVQAAEWARMALGVNRIIRYDEISGHTEFVLQAKLDDLTARCRRAFEIVDIPLFQKCMDEFFMFPSWILCQKEPMLFFQQVQSLFWEMNGDRIAEFADLDSWRRTVTEQLHARCTFASCKRLLVEKLTEIMTQITDNISQQNTRPVKLAFAYVEKYYGSQITLESVAKEINLSPVYFSSLFKRETGQNFTEYVTEYRMRVARDLLKNSGKNINEIADELGYADARYFSKIFKKTVGVKPTEYRKIYR